MPKLGYKQTEEHRRKTSGEKHWNWKGGSIKKSCKLCNKTFYRKPCQVKSAKFCSKQCANDKTKVQRVCPCKKVFKIGLSEAKRGRKYCSRSCCVKFFSPASKIKIFIDCQFCRKKIKTWPSRSVSKKFCSRSCRNKYLWQIPEYKSNFISKVTGKVAWNKGKVGLYKTSELTKLKLSETSRGRKHTEDAKRKISISKLGEKNPVHRPEVRLKVSKSWFKIGDPRISGPNSHSWKGGITSLKMKIRALPEYIKWRKLIFVRDNFTCNSCGVRGGRLNADHINPFSKIILENKIENTNDARNCTSLWDTNNGRTLCVTCHRNTDTYAGRSLNRI